jgi:hypothetical protein
VLAVMLLIIMMLGRSNRHHRRARHLANSPGTAPGGCNTGSSTAHASCLWEHALQITPCIAKENLCNNPWERQHLFGALQQN